MNLYKLKTKGLKEEYFVIANHPTEACIKLKTYLKQYDYSDVLKVMEIHLVAESTDNEFITNKNLIL